MSSGLHVMYPLLSEFIEILISSSDFLNTQMSNFMKILPSGAMRTDGRTGERTGERTDGRTNGRTKERTDGRTNERTDERTDGRTKERTDGRMDERKNERTNGRTDERTNERTNEQTKGRTNERTDEETNTTKLTVPLLIEINFRTQVCKCQI